MFKHGFPPEWSTLKKLIWLVGSGIAGAAAGVWKTVTGTLIHITDALASPMRKCEVTLEPIQDLHGQDAPYPAGGGKNLVDPSACTLGKRLDNVGGLSNASNWAVTDFIPCQPNTNYCARSVIPAANGYAYCFYDSSKRFLRYATISGTSSVATSGVRNSGADAAYLRLTVAKNNLENTAYCSQSSSLDYFSPYSNICPITGWTGANINVSGADTSSPTIYPISWQAEAGTVYGGTLTVNEDGSCDLVSKWVQDTFPSNSVVNNSGTSASGGTWCSYRHVLSGANKSYGNTPTNGDSNGLFNIGKWRKGAEAGKCRAYTITNGAELYCTLVSDQYDLSTLQGRTDYYTNVLGEAVPTVCYKLATPITYHLDSIAQITTLAGENNIWADVNGEITLTYKANA